jgi:Protein of unknown function (DUF3617)
VKLHRLLVVLAVCAFAASASAQDLKPGLWEVTTKMQSASGEMEAATAEMQQQMASMPADQRKMMEEMMAKQGVKMGAGGPGEMVAKTCMTREMIERNEIPAQQGNCKTTTQARSGKTMKMTFACTDPPSSGEGQHTIVSPEAYTTKMVVRTTAQGKPETMNMNGSGKWLGSDCGNIKPLKSPTLK